MTMIRKGVIPAAGLGTRLSPLTRGQSKEMLPIGGRPMIFYAVVEAALSGLEELCIVINQRKNTLRHYLESRQFREEIRKKKGIDGIPLPQIAFVDQPSPLGSGEAIYRTKDRMGSEPFALIMPDFIFAGPSPPLIQMIPLYGRFRQDTVGVLNLGAVEAQGFGNVGIIHAKWLEKGVVKVLSISGKSRSPLALGGRERILKLAGRWILGPHFFSYLERVKAEGEEWDDTPAYQAICSERKVIGKVLEGTGFDVGHTTGYHAATLRFFNGDCCNDA